MIVSAAVIGVAALGKTDLPLKNNAFNNDDFPALTLPIIPIRKRRFSFSILFSSSSSFLALPIDSSLFNERASSPIISTYFSQIFSIFVSFSKSSMLLPPNVIFL